ncbi:tripartite tricarboxylate transporter TctB family protein [Vreelandella olivaria]|uniref:tripartite tricarboxylate transporter TctB family protein n=1 Tax=Vreelandella olivaria TaxID=390919 RepID=UPI00201F27C3|nr:tripartite tricarboxylate transporter TctB family protein [Halomonas olivaria]
MNFLIKRDVLAGLMCLMVSALVLWEGQNYTQGTLQSMGPGYLPRVLGLGLAGCGLLIMLSALRSSEALPKLNVRAFCLVTLAILVFAFTLNWLGLFLATFLLVFISSLSEKRLRFRVTGLLALALCGLSYLIFIVGLNMPIRLFPWSF